MANAMIAALYRFLFSVIKMFNINKLATEIVAFDYELGIRRTLGLSI